MVIGTDPDGTRKDGDEPHPLKKDGECPPYPHGHDPFIFIPPGVIHIPLASDDPEKKKP